MGMHILLNDNLQLQLQTIFSHWFIQSETPSSWSMGRLADIADITMGQSPTGKSYNEDGDGVAFYQGSTDFGDVFPSARVYTTQPNRMAKTMDTLVSVRAPVGSLNIAFEDCCIGRGLAAVRGATGNNAFVRYLLKCNDWYFRNANNGGTTFASITKDDLFGMPVVIPDRRLVDRFEAMAVYFETLIHGNEQENRALKALRDWLLPMLMNGQATVRPQQANYRLSDC